MIDKVRAWEQSVERTFFPPIVPGIAPRPSPATGKLEVFNWIDEVVLWARTSRGGKQFNIFSTLPRPICESSFGLCE